MADTTVDMGADDGADGQWLTHSEIAMARGISTASAIKLALRHRWRKQKDNRGTLRCLVPMSFIGPQPGIRADMGAVSRADAGADTRADLSAVIVTLQAAVTLLGDQLAHERTRADTAQAERDAGRARIDDLTAKLGDAQGELAAAREQTEAARKAQREAEGHAAELRRADAEQRARGRWARLRAAWHGE